MILTGLFIKVRLVNSHVYKEKIPDFPYPVRLARLSIRGLALNIPLNEWGQNLIKLIKQNVYYVI
jgi:hypothetical protein